MDSEPHINSPADGNIADVRMRGFAQRTTVVEALKWLDARLSRLAAESVGLSQAAGRVLSADVTASRDIPCFDRSMMDGFALHASETHGATSYNPLEFTIVGESLPGAPYEGAVATGQAVRIMTGAPLPRGCDSVLPVEKTEVQGPRLQALDEVSPEKHVGRRGEDVRTGDVVLKAGRKLRPQDVGLLSSLGVGEVIVVRKPRVRLVITGNELLPSGTPPEGFRIADANGPMLAALVARDGGIPIHPGIVHDRPDLIRAALQDESRRDPADIVLISGGSSVGIEDHAPRLVAELGELPIHGIAMRPSSPTGMGIVDGRLVFLLPGNPVSCLCAYDFFAGRAIRALGGLPNSWPYPQLRLSLARKLSSVVGRVDYARVCIIDGQVEPSAVGGASILSSTTAADGFVVVPTDSEGYAAGTEVDVFLYDLP